jgi:hypothetical protein
MRGNIVAVFGKKKAISWLNNSDVLMALRGEKSPQLYRKGWSLGAGAHRAVSQRGIAMAHHHFWLHNHIIFELAGNNIFETKVTICILMLNRNGLIKLNMSLMFIASVITKMVNSTSRKIRRIGNLA